MSWGFILGDDLLIYTTAFLWPTEKSAQRFANTLNTCVERHNWQRVTRSRILNCWCNWYCLLGNAHQHSRDGFVRSDWISCGCEQMQLIIPWQSGSNWGFHDSCYCVWTLSSLITFLLFLRARKFLLNHCWRQCQVFVFSLKVEITTFNDS